MKFPPFKYKKKNIEVLIYPKRPLIDRIMRRFFEIDLDTPCGNSNRTLYFVIYGYHRIALKKWDRFNNQKMEKKFRSWGVDPGW